MYLVSSLHVGPYLSWASDEPCGWGSSGVFTGVMRLMHKSSTSAAERIFDYMYIQGSPNLSLEGVRIFDGEIKSTAEIWTDGAPSWMIQNDGMWK